MAFRINIGFPPFSAIIELSEEGDCSNSLSEECSSIFTLNEEGNCTITLGN